MLHRRRYSLVTLWAALALLCPAQVVTAAGEPSFDITSVEAAALSNAVQVRIVSNGNVSFNMDKWSDGRSYTGFTEPGSDGVMAARAIAMNIPNARSSTGDYVYIGKYPVSHVELSTPPAREVRRGKEAGPSLDVVVCLYTGAKMRSVDGDTWDMEASDSQIAGADQVFDVKLSQDRRSIIVTVTRDQRVQTVMRRSPKDVPDNQRHLEVAFEDDLLELRARNVELAHLMSVVTELTGVRIQVDADTSRLVSAELKRISVSDFIDRIAECYGLERSQSDGTVMLSDVLNRTASAFTSSRTHRLPVRSLRAEDARELLPTFLMEYISVDKSNNELIVSGSGELAEKIRKDLDILDKPPPMVTAKVRLIEVVTEEGLEKSLGLDYSSEDWAASLQPENGRLTFSKLDGQPHEIEAGLEWLVASAKAVVHSEANVTVINGRTGQIFAGQSKYIAVQDIYGEGRAIPVSSGTRLRITPRAGAETMTLWVSAEMTEIESTDPVTNLPTVSTRSLEGSFRIKSGDSLLVGGLSRMQPQQDSRGIPGASAAPIVGSLFESRSSKDSTSELVILITPTIM